MEIVQYARCVVLVLSLSACSTVHKPWSNGFGPSYDKKLILIRDDGRYANSPLKHWFEGLRSQRGLCCTFADGVTVQDVDYDTDGQEDGINSAYRVRVTKDWGEEFQSYWGQYIPVPKTALLEQPNKAGAAIVWPYISSVYQGGKLAIRCFIPGAGI